MFDGEQAKGPVPRLFALNPEEAKANLSNDPERAFRDLQRIFSRLGVTENIPAHPSLEMVSSLRQVHFRFCPHETPSVAMSLLASFHLRLTP
jgi:hypothetical protein